MNLLDRQDVEAAAGRLRGRIRRTPVLQVDVDRRPLFLKLEQLQVTGSFKVRGAMNALAGLEPRPRAVVAASGGNHGLGVAHAAAALGVAATVVVPLAVPAEKARRLSALGATVVRHGDEYAAAEGHARALAAELDAPFVHPFADPAVIAGQGTVGLELSADPGGRCDAVVVAVGGGGLVAGIATALEGGPRVVGVEPEGIPTLHAALRAGRPVDVEVRSLTADALGARSTAPLNLAIAQQRVDEVVLVSDAATLAARAWLWRHCRLAVEPAAAVGLAAVLDGAVDSDAPCVVLCGANAAWTPHDG